MYVRLISTLLFLTFCSLSTFVVATPPPPPSDDIMIVISPSYGNYTVGDELYVRANILSKMFKERNPVLTISIQKSIRYPKLNEEIGNIRARFLEDSSGFMFLLKKKWLIKEQSSVPFRIRVSWSAPKSGYQDSEDFYFHK
ncbi:hypothetical protein BGZ65_007968 [Modicella reniformis]|uniref:Uncharacterized protein n=1 Tax=Modicella reniformis TaxID=1440133 RepID=A0A9P6SSA3_9FUNG|nr:hypothetical protein BGZ65_007968 [Modicella reniformis]